MQSQPSKKCITIPCKKYIRKYVEAVYGSPFEANCYSSIGQFIVICLEKKIYNANKLPVQGASRHYTDTLSIEVSLHNYENIGFDLHPNNILAINNFIEEIFSEHLFLWCQINTQKDGRYKGYSECIRAFAKLHNIELDDKEDITFDSLKKSELRYRNGKGDGITLIGLVHKERRQRKAVELRLK